MCFSCRNSTHYWYVCISNEIKSVKKYALVSYHLLVKETYSPVNPCYFQAAYTHKKYAFSPRAGV